MWAPSYVRVFNVVFHDEMVKLVPVPMLVGVLFVDASKLRSAIVGESIPGLLSKILEIYFQQSLGLTGQVSFDLPAFYCVVVMPVSDRTDQQEHPIKRAIASLRSLKSRPLGLRPP